MILTNIIKMKKKASKTIIDFDKWINNYVSKLDSSINQLFHIIDEYDSERNKKNPNEKYINELKIRFDYHAKMIGLNCDMRNPEADSFVFGAGNEAYFHIHKIYSFLEDALKHNKNAKDAKELNKDITKIYAFSEVLGVPLKSVRKKIQDVLSC